MTGGKPQVRTGVGGTVPFRLPTFCTATADGYLPSGAVLFEGREVALRHGDLTATADAEAGSRTVEASLASGSVSPGDPVVAYDAESGRVYTLSVADYDSGSEVLTLAHDLSVPLPLGTVLRSLVGAVALEADEVEFNKQNYRLFVTITDALGAVSEREVLFDSGLVQGYNPATFAHLEAEWDDIRDYYSSTTLTERYFPQLDAAYAQVFRSLSAVGRNVNRLREREAVVPAILCKVRLLLAENGVAPEGWADDLPGYHRLWHEKYEEELRLLLANAEVWYDDDEDGKVDVDEVPRPRRRRLRR